MAGTTILAQMAGSAAAQGVNQIFADYNRKQDEASAERLANHNANLAQLAQKNSAKNMVEGYKMAGLNPALVAGSNFSPAIGASPSVSHQSPQMSAPDIAQLSLTESQKNLIDEQARELKLKNDATDDENETADTNLRAWLNSQIDSPDVSEDEKNRYRNLLDLPQFSIGSQRGLDRYFDLLNKDYETVSNRYVQLYQKELYNEFLKNGVAGTNAKIPKEELNQLSESVANLQQARLLMQSEVDLNQKQLKALDAQIQKDLATAKSIYHGDINQMLDNGDYKGLAFKAVANVADKGLDVAGAYITAGRYAKAFEGTRAMKELTAPTRAQQIQKELPSPLRGSMRSRDALARAIGNERANDLYQSWLANHRGQSFTQFLYSKGFYQHRGRWLEHGDNLPF